MAIKIITKRCFKCKKTKPLSEFSKNRCRKDGYHNDCKICQRAYQKCYSQSKKGNAKIKHYRQTEKARILNREGVRRYSQSEKGKTKRKSYRESPQGKATIKRFYQCHPNYSKNYYACYPHYWKATSKVRNAIKAGKLPRPNTRLCHYCPKPAQQYHHWKGYEPEHWLDVIPVCKDCHKKLHRKTA